MELPTVNTHPVTEFIHNPTRENFKIAIIELQRVANNVGESWTAARIQSGYGDAFGYSVEDVQAILDELTAETGLQF
jgi:hypothetical protein